MHLAIDQAITGGVYDELKEQDNKIMFSKTKSMEIIIIMYQETGRTMLEAVKPVVAEGIDGNHNSSRCHSGGN